MKHKGTFEKTNHGYRFADCSCGWAGGVYSTYQYAKMAHTAHVNGGSSEVGKVKPIFQIGGPVVGMEQ